MSREVNSITGSVTDYEDGRVVNFEPGWCHHVSDAHGYEWLAVQEMYRELGAADLYDLPVKAR